MISFIRGKIKAKDEEFVIVENNDIGFKVFVSPKTLEKLNIGEVGFDAYRVGYAYQHCGSASGFLPQ
ncbi:hypothetical protein KJ562_00575 [Patescibacteria group bacterium]|nr:hypothetical protein [Patescibacteria group bacterium]MBU4162025.1 hypothetical protein [Patescibacteria group bacterium]